ncbi:hypothetical protein BLOT_004405 [Blomia tropicalis]|nr:hypothetical protein BLOT_004405 [Blomia tropicalis]
MGRLDSISEDLWRQETEMNECMNLINNNVFGRMRRQEALVIEEKLGRGKGGYVDVHLVVILVLA